MNIVLIGYRGTGKSTVGEILAARLGMERISIDSAIVDRAGMSIPEIVAQHGWPHFRDLESDLVRELSSRDNLVIDCGGGVIERTENIAVLQRNARIVWLTASVATIVARIEGGTERPSLTAGKTFTEEVAEVLERRNPLYRSAAHHEIATDGLAPEQIVDRIAETLCNFVTSA